MKPNTSTRTDEQNTDEEPAMQPPRAAAESDVKRAEQRAEQAEQRTEELREELEAKDETIEELRELVESQRERIDDLEELVDGYEETIAELRERVGTVEGDLTCPTCEEQIRATRVEEVLQEESESGGVLKGKKYEGPVKTLRCPHCDELQDVTQLSDAERTRLTNSLREQDVANGEVQPVEESDDQAESSGEESGEDGGE